MAMNFLRTAAKESKILKFVLGGFIFLAVGGLVFSDVRGFFTGGGATGTTIAKIDGTKIPLSQFDAELGNFLRQTGMTKEDAYQTGLIHAFLNSKIEQIINVRAAHDLDLNIDNTVIAKEIKKSFGDTPTDQIKMILRAQGISEQELESSIRNQTLSAIIQQMPLSVFAFVPQPIATATSKVTNQKRTGTIYTKPLADFAESVDVTDQEIADYYNNHKNEYLIMEERQFVIGTKSIDDVKSMLPAITQDDIQAEYESRLDDFTTPQQRTIEQVQINDVDKANAIYAKALEGESLKSLAAQNNATYLAPSKYSESDLTEEIADNVFAPETSVNDVTPPVKTLLGYSITKLTAITPEKIAPLSAVKADLVKDMKDAAMYDTIYNIMVDTENMVDTGQSFDDIAETTKLKTSTSNFYTVQSILNTKNKTLKNIIANNPSVIDELFALGDDMATYPIELDETHYAVIGLKSMKAQSYIPLNDVKTDIKKDITHTKLASIAKAETDALIDQLNNADDSVDLKKQGFTAKSFNMAYDTGTVTPQSQTIFATAVGHYNSVINDDNDQANIIFVKTLDTASKPDIAFDDIQNRQRQMVSSMLYRYWMDKYNVHINDDLLRRTYGE